MTKLQVQSTNTDLILIFIVNLLQLNDVLRARKWQHPEVVGALAYDDENVDQH